MAQQHFVADHDGADGVAVALRRVDHQRDLAFVVRRIAADPGPEQHLEPEFACDFRYLREALGDGVRAHAARPLREQCKIALQLLAGHAARVANARSGGCIRDALQATGRAFRNRHGLRVEPPATEQGQRGNDDGNGEPARRRRWQAKAWH